MCNVVKTGDVEPSLQEIPVMREFSDVFPEEIPVMPSLREVEFCIDLTFVDTPISKAPYHIAPAKLKELKTQLDELLEKGYI